MVSQNRTYVRETESAAIEREPLGVRVIAPEEAARDAPTAEASTSDTRDNKATEQQQRTSQRRGSTNAYRPLATRTNRGSSPRAPMRRHQLTDSMDTDSPSCRSIAAWISMSLIGPARSTNTRTTASSTQPGRRCRSRRLTMARGWASLALRPANFSASWLNPDRASCAASAAISSDTILSIAPESWFDSTCVACISAGLNVAIRTTRGRACGAASADSLRPWPTTSEGAPSSTAPAVCSASRRSCRR